MNHEAAFTNYKQISNPLPVICIIIIWLLTTYFLYTHKAQNPEVKKLSDSRISQIKILLKVTPTPKVSIAKYSHANENSVASASQNSANDSGAAQDTPSTNNSKVNSDTNNTNTISPTQVPVPSIVSGEEIIPTLVPQPTSDENGSIITPVPTGGQSSNDNSVPVGNNLANTVDNLSQALPLGLVNPGQ